jgi:hypothetical protein
MKIMAVITDFRTKLECFAPVRPFQPYVMFVGMTRLERSAWGKHSRLLRKSVNYNRKFFITFGSGARVIKVYTPVIYDWVK